MNEKELHALQGAIRHARNMIDLFATKTQVNPDYSRIENQQLYDMYLGLNNMSIEITQMITELPW